MGRQRGIIAARWIGLSVSLLLATRALCGGDTLPRAQAARGGQLEITVVDRQTQELLPCRMHLRNAAGRPRKPKKMPFWGDHFVFPGKITLKLPVGQYDFELERGPEYLVRTGHFTINNFADDSKTVDMRRFVNLAAEGWWSGDLHVRRPLEDIELLMRAEDLHVVPLITWWGDKQPASGKSPPADLLVRFDGNRYYHVMGGGHARAGGELLYFNLPAPLKFAEAGPEYPPPIMYLDQVREHPDAWVDLSKPFWWDLPMLVANRQVDSIQLAHSQMCRDRLLGNEAGGKARDKAIFPDPWGNARWSHHIYFHLLNCGLRIPPTAGSGSGVAPNPVGYNRVYVHVAEEFSYENWWKNLRAGRVVLTNGPLLRPIVEGQLPGHVFHAEQGRELELEIGLTLSTREPISYLELIKNGRVEHSVRLDEYAKTGKLPKLHFAESGWFLVRAVTDVQQTYRFGMTGPYYVQIGYQPRISRKSVQFFLDWLHERAKDIKLDDPAQRREVLKYHRAGRDFWEKLLSKANAE